jgi:hypothetical protein
MPGRIQLAKGRMMDLFLRLNELPGPVNACGIMLVKVVNGMLDQRQFERMRIEEGICAQTHEIKFDLNFDIDIDG